MRQRKIKYNGTKLQRVDHNDNFRMLPKRVTTSVAWRQSQFRMRAVMIAFLNAFDGTNNGKIAFAIKQLGEAVGSKSHSLNAKAVAEAIEKGFLECTSEADRAHAKARTYRITFASTCGADGNLVPATHEYDEWRPVKKRKFGGGRTTMCSHEKTTVTATTLKKPVGETTTCSTENCGFQGDEHGGETPTHLYTIPPTSKAGSDHSENLISRTRRLPTKPGGDSLVDLEVLREWARQAVDAAGYGGNNCVAADAGINAVQLSRFRNGKGLLEEHRAGLQMACARIIPYKSLAAQ